MGTTNGISGVVGSQTGSIQGSAGQNNRPTMTQTTHGKNFGYNMHRKTNSNKLPHIASSNGKETVTNQSLQQSTTNTYQRE
mmetsp:Transcript_9974/g.16760  ORF Transcript_9974/g.16760 Transcript_9974/m.16760 type:complete len:81 (-) Transcript_9974:194-436(-)